MEKLNVCFCSYPFFSSHAKALYLYMKKYCGTLNLYWVVNNQNEKNFLMKIGVKAYIINTKEFYNKMKVTDLFFTTHGNLIDYKNEKSIYVELWHGIGVKPAGYLLNRISNFDESWTNEFRKKIDYLIVPTEFWKIIFSCLFQIDPRRVLPIGYPKFYLQQKANSTKNLEKIINIDTKKYEKIILYLPTIRKAQDKKTEINIDANKIFGFNEENLEDINSFLKNNKYLLCIKYHPSENALPNITENENIKILDNDIMKSKCVDIDEIINCADFVISDYSSILIEAIYLKKKVIFLNNNINEFNKNRGIFFNMYDYWANNLSVNDWSSLKKQLLSLDKNIDEEKYKMWFGNIKNGGCRNIVNYFIENGKIKRDINQNINAEFKLEKQLKNLKEKMYNLENQITIIEQENQNNIVIINQKNVEILDKTNAINDLNKKNEQNLKQISIIEKELNDIASSKTYKFARILQKIKQKIFRR